MNMSKEQTNFYLDILGQFYNMPALLKILPVTRPTLQRWLDKETVPSDKYLKMFQKALDHLTTELIDKGGVMAEIGEFIEGLPEPVARPQHFRLASKTQNIQAMLQEVLGDHKEHRSSGIIEALMERGHTRINIQVAATRMGIIKNHIGQGRASYSLWRLPQ